MIAKVLTNSKCLGFSLKELPCTNSSKREHSSIRSTNMFSFNKHFSASTMGQTRCQLYRWTKKYKDPPTDNICLGHGGVTGQYLSLRILDKENISLSLAYYSLKNSLIIVCVSGVSGRENAGENHHTPKCHGSNSWNKQKAINKTDGVCPAQVSFSC